MNRFTTAEECADACISNQAEPASTTAVSPTDGSTERSTVRPSTAGDRPAFLGTLLDLGTISNSTFSLGKVLSLLSLCIGAFLCVHYSFLLISNNFWDLSLLHWRGDIEMCEGGRGSTARKIYCTGPWKLMYIKLPMGHWLIRPGT